MEDTDEENLHNGNANSTKSISNRSIVSSGRRMLELFDDTALDEMEELLEELAIAAVYDNDNTNNGQSSIAGMIQQNQWQ
jgi:hypothetical protein